MEKQEEKVSPFVQLTYSAISVSFLFSKENAIEFHHTVYFGKGINIFYGYSLSVRLQGLQDIQRILK